MSTEAVRVIYDALDERIDALVEAKREGDEQAAADLVLAERMLGAIDPVTMTMRSAA